MGLEQCLRLRLSEALHRLARAGELDPALAREARFAVEPPRKGGSGDLATNVALVLGKPAGKNPRELAGRIAEELRTAPEVRQIDVAGPGFLNVSLEPAAFHAVLRDVIRAGRGYGRAPSATRERVNVEFVSANPTGPLLISHGRGAVVGDVVARLLEATGYRVTREYYLNDFGNQVRLLGESVRAAHDGVDPPEGGYGGDYVREIAAWMEVHRPELLEPGTGGELQRQCVLLMLDGVPGTKQRGIRRALDDLGIEFDVWSSEEALHHWGRVQRTLERLEEKRRLERLEDGAVVFVTGDEDEKNRVVRKRDGAYTYFASDIAYHDDKIARGFERLIDVWGADHHGYVARTRAAIEALEHDAGRFEVVLFQLVSLMRGTEKVRMGKRLGNLITLEEVMEEIDEAVKNPHAGRDALRFFFLWRRVDTPIVLDVELAKKQKQENPVFYVQYGHARLCSILRRARDKFALEVPPYTDALAARIEHPLELALLARLGRFPDLLEEAAQAREPQKLLVYLEETARDFQSYYTELYRDGDAILPRERDMAEGWRERWDWEKTLARLLWVDAIRAVYRSGLELVGLQAPEQMRVPETETAEEA
jgi:arginyl-tRNA synthetase